MSGFFIFIIKRRKHACGESKKKITRKSTRKRRTPRVRTILHYYDAMAVAVYIMMASGGDDDGGGGGGDEAYRQKEKWESDRRTYTRSGMRALTWTCVCVCKTVRQRRTHSTAECAHLASACVRRRIREKNKKYKWGTRSVGPTGGYPEWQQCRQR